MQLKDDGGTANGGVDVSGLQNFSITVNFVNEAPSFTPGGNVTVVENTGPAIISNWATGMSPGVGANEASQSLNFNVTNDNNALFASQPTIDALTGTLLFTPAADAFGVATVTVSLQDSGGTANGGTDVSAPQTFKITVDPINEAPSFTGGPNESNLEDAGLTLRRLGRESEHGRSAADQPDVELHRQQRQHRFVLHPAGDRSPDGNIDLYAGAQRERHGERDRATARRRRHGQRRRGYVGGLHLHHRRHAGQ